MLAAPHGSAQTISAQEYINTYKDIAIKEMKRTGIPASITPAHRDSWKLRVGNSELVKKSSNNHFGIKCKSNWSGESVSWWWCPANVPEVQQCYRQLLWSQQFPEGSSRYAFLFQLDPMDYKGWAYGLKKQVMQPIPLSADIDQKHWRK